MRILSIQSDLPEPTFGGRKRVFHLIQALVEAGHEIDMLVMLDSDEASRLKSLQEMGVRTHAVLFDTPQATNHRGNPLQRVTGKLDAAYRFRRSALRALTSPTPQAAKAHWITPLRRALRALLQHQSFDLILVENEENALLWNDLPRGVPAAIDVQNVLSSMKQREVEMQSKRDIFALYRLSERAQPSKLRRLERWMLQRFDAAIAMSEREARTLREIAPEFTDRVYVVPNGVDTASYDSGEAPSGAAKLVYTGLMSYAPNDDAMRWFGREIWPLIVAAIPEATLDIVGAEPSPAVLALAQDERIRVTGRVDLVQPYLEEANVVIVPLRMGGGTRLKILEAAAMRRPMVSTRVGAEGLDEFADGEHLLLRDAPQEFADAVVQLLRNPNESLRLSIAARKVVEETYDWTHIGSQFNEIISRVAHSPNIK